MFRPVYAALAFAVAGLAVAKSDRLEVALPATLDRIADVKQVEVREAGGRTIASGTFATSRDSESTRERTAALTGSGASGTAEIELKKSFDSYTKRELEVTLAGLAPEARYDLVVDGANVLTFASTKRGRAELKLSTDVDPEGKRARWRR
jgi:hypothetical protein